MEVLLSIMPLYFRKTLFSQHATKAGWKETMHHVVTFLGRNTPWCWSDDFHQLQLCPKCTDGMILQLANETIKINIIVARIQQSCPWPSCQKCSRYRSPPLVRRIICFASLCIALHGIAFHCTALLSIALHCLVLHCIAFTLHCLEKTKWKANDAFCKMKSNRAIM